MNWLSGVAMAGSAYLCVGIAIGHVASSPDWEAFLWGYIFLQQGLEVLRNNL